MVRFFNKSLRSHQSKDYNKISDLMSDETSLKLRELLKLHIKDFYSISPYEYEHLFEKLHVNIGLNKFEKEKKVFDDFKEVIKKFSIGEHKDSLRLCCIVLEDYFCVILNKDSCNNIEKYYKNVAKRLNINENLNNRFENIIKYIHKYRSIPSHGSKENKEIEDLELLNQTIIIFTMSILNYIKNKIEQTH